MKIFNIVINEDDNTGMDTISLVSSPAVGVNFLKFEEQKEIKKLSFDADKHIITGVVALAGIPIYRYDKEIGDYYVVFTSEVIYNGKILANGEGKSKKHAEMDAAKHAIELIKKR